MAASALRAERLRRIKALKRQGLSSPQIARELGIAPSTVRDYLNDPYRQKARRRQRRWAVEGVSMPAGGTEISAVKGKTKKWHPHEGKGRIHNQARGRQMRAVIGYYAGG